jgi:hypothetical protein
MITEKRADDRPVRFAAVQQDRDRHRPYRQAERHDLDQDHSAEHRCDRMTAYKGDAGRDDGGKRERQVGYVYRIGQSADPDRGREAAADRRQEVR